MQSGKIRLATLLLPALLAACGGGGSDATVTTPTAPGTPPAPPAVSQLVITTANAQPVAADALQTTGSNGVATVGTGFVTGVQVQGAAAGAGPVTLAGAARALLARRPVSPPLATGVSASETAACSGGGSIIVTVTSGGGQESLAMNASACVELVDGIATRMNGRMTLTVVGSYDPNAAVWPQSFDMTIVANGFALTQSGRTTVSDGTLRLNFFDDRSAQIVVLRSDALSSSVSDASGTRSVTLRNYSQQVSTDATKTTATQVTADVETDSARLGSGKVAYRISAQAQPLVVDGTGVYRSGTLQVTGQGSGLLLTVTGPDLFQLQLDTDGDGSPDASSAVTRAQLEAAL